MITRVSPLNIAAFAALGPLLLTTPARSLVAQNAPSDTFHLAWQAFVDNRFTDARPLFMAAARFAPNDAERLVWVAETARRMEEFDTALLEARRALQLRPCSSFAHDVLGSVFNPQFGTWPGSNQDSASVHYRAAVACDSTDGNAWLSIVFDAMRQGDTTLAHRALRKLVETGFLTPPWMSYARWVLESLPERAILLTFGDMDTYPLIALQALGTRKDVAVVNTNLLNLDWYVTRLIARYDLPRGPARAPLASSTTGAALYIAALQEAALASRLGRALTQIAFDTTVLLNGAELHWAGSHWLVAAKATAPVHMTSAVMAALRSAEALDWRGAAVAARDRSPIRLKYTVHPAFYPAYSAVSEAHAALERNDTAQARVLVEWTEAFLKRAGISDESIDEFLGDLRSAVAP